MLRTLRYQQRARLAAPFEVLWAWLAEPEHLPELHPLMRQLTIIERGGDEVESFVDFEVVDGLPLGGGLELPVTYSALMLRRPRDRYLHVRATAIPKLVTTSEWSFTDGDDGVEIVEDVVLTAPWPIAGYALKHSQRSHEAVLAALERRLEGDCPAEAPVE
ncbi:MAG TPA: hypothetical protein ENK57_12635 [Polyangiaceae bacterium]|nr:hypothetical protein [Polyangiaceae bacterium]